ncbi:hypothetical protein CsSME_00045720 [Camellia sinensis var. sinensis]
MMRALGNLVPFVIQPPNMDVTHPKIQNDRRYWPWFKFNRQRRYHGPKELFNHRHSSLRNVIERTFGVLKQRFPLLRHMPRYDMSMMNFLMLNNQVTKMKMALKTKMNMKVKVEVKVQVKFRVKVELKMSTEMKMEYQLCNNRTIWDNGEMRLQHPCGRHTTISYFLFNFIFLYGIICFSCFHTMILEADIQHGRSRVAAYTATAEVDEGSTAACDGCIYFVHGPFSCGPCTV